jgi:hypothetical protein
MGQCHLDGSRYDHLRVRVVEPGIGEAQEKRKNKLSFFLKVLFNGVRFTYVSSLGSDSNSNNGKDIQENSWVP